MENYVNTEELKHYGVLGMKWGVRRGKYSKTFAKSSKHLNKIDESATAMKSKASKLSYKGLKKETYARTERGRRKGRNLQLKGNRLDFESAKLQAKGRKFETKMAKEFAGVKVSDIQPEHLEIGKKYAYMLINDNRRKDTKAKG